MNLTRYRLKTFLPLLLLGVVLLQLPAEARLKPKPLESIQIHGQRFELEVATTHLQKQQGLMFRAALPEREGMLFPFDPPQEVNFWMKNCKIPLDILFIRGNRILHIVQEAPPCLVEPCPLYSSNFTVDRVVELAGGSAQKYGIVPGDLLKKGSRN